MAHAPTSPRIAIIGAGISGLCAAVSLLDHGYGSTIFEASDRVGGRIRSDRSSWMDQQVTEVCGELIDSDHATMRALTKRFGLDLVDLRASERKGATKTAYFGGAYYDEPERAAELAVAQAAAARDADAAGYPANYRGSTNAAKRLDRTSVADWIDVNVPGGRSSRLGMFLDVTYRALYGRDTAEQSALNLIFVLGAGPPRTGWALGVSDERYRIAGGNDRLVERMARQVRLGSPVCTIELNSALVGVARDPDGAYRLRLQSGGSVSQREVDRVVLALPFSALRRVDCAAAGFGDLKWEAIERLGYGSHWKLHLQFRARIWRAPGPWGASTGGSCSDAPYQTTWESTRGQPGQSGILTVFAAVDATRPVPDPVTAAGNALPGLDRTWPGVAAEWNGLATISAPAADPWRLGSYSCYLPGQWTLFAGVEGERAGNCHFAGEHTSSRFQGYMEGAAAEGFRAADEILADYRAGRFP